MSDTELNSAETHEATGVPRYDDVNTPVILMVGFISAVVTFLIIALVQGMAYHWEKSYLREMEVVSWPSAEQIAEQKKVLAGGEGVVPIEEAMAEVIQKYKK